MKKYNLAVSAALAVWFGAVHAQAQSTGCAGMNATAAGSLASLASAGAVTDFLAGEHLTLRVTSFGAGPNPEAHFVIIENGGSAATFDQFVNAPGLLSYELLGSDPTNLVYDLEASGSVSVDYRFTCQFGVPTVTSLGATSGSTAGGTSVVITGNNLGGATAVNFGGTAAASFVVNSNTQITAVSPAKAAGLAQVQVVGANGSSANTAGDDFTFSAPASSVPTLSEWAMILMTTLLAGFGGLIVMRRRGLV